MKPKTAIDCLPVQADFCARLVCGPSSLPKSNFGVYFAEADQGTEAGVRKRSPGASTEGKAGRFREGLTTRQNAQQFVPISW